MYTKTFKLPFNSAAHTLRPEELGHHINSKWTITGEIQEDYYEWVNYFEAHHPEYGVIKGDFEHSVEAESQEAYLHFVKHHEPESWDYYDI